MENNWYSVGRSEGLAEGENNPDLSENEVTSKAESLADSKNLTGTARGDFIAGYITYYAVGRHRKLNPQ